jgi:nucleoside-diphosphate-sugar epimerase
MSSPNEKGTTATNALAEANGLPQCGGFVQPSETILVTGANGFIGKRVVRRLLVCGFLSVRCFVRPTAAPTTLIALAEEFGHERIEIITGNLTSRDDCQRAAQGVAVVLHLAAGTDKTFPGCYLNSVVATRNLLDAIARQSTLKRFVNVSSLSVYAGENVPRGGKIDEACDIAHDFVARHDPYAYAKAHQDRLVIEYGRKEALPYVIVRPAVTFGPGKAKIPGRVGIDTFGVFMHLGMGNRVPLTYVDNCADAIVLAGIRKGINHEVINIVDDDLPRSREFLRAFKRNVRPFFSLPVPYPVFYLFSGLWERYSRYSEGQLPAVFNRSACAAYYRRHIYPNTRAKKLLGWEPRICMAEAIERYCEYARHKSGRS